MSKKTTKTEPAPKKRILQPVGPRVLVKRVEAEEKSPGGIILPENAKEKPLEGIVAAVGEGRKTEDGKLIPMSLETGDRVLFSPYGGQEVKIDGEVFTVLDEGHIIAILR